MRYSTCAFSPNSLWKMPNVPGPQTSCVISLSTLVQMFWPGTTLVLSLCLAKIFSVMVIGLFTCTQADTLGQKGRPLQTTLRTYTP